MLSLKATNESLQLQTGASAPTFQFPSDVTSSAGPAVTGTSVNVGFVFQVLTNVTATGIRYYSSSPGIAVTPSLFDDFSGALIATGPSYTTTTVGWEFVPFSSVFYLVPAVFYVVNAYVPSGQYNSVTVGGFPLSDGVVYNSSVSSGRYQYNGALTKPTSSSAIRYAVDVVVQQNTVNLFPSDSTGSAGSSYNDAAPLNVGFLFAVNSNAVATGIRYNAPSSGIDITPTLYDDRTGTVLATGPSYTTIGGGWVIVPFYTSYTLAPGVDYVASIWSSTGKYYAASAGGFPCNDGLVYTTVDISGRFLYSAAAKPTATTRARYGLDIVVQQITQGPTPTIKGYAYLNNNNATTTSLTVTPDSTIAPGDWMIMVIETFTGGGTVTDPPGWTVIQPVTASGSQITAIYAKNRVAGETSYSIAMTSSANSSTLTLMWGSGAAPMSSWIIGANMLRPNITPPTSTNNVAPSLTTTSANNLVLALSTERTNANESSIASMTGASQWFYGTQFDASTIQTLSIGYIKQTKPGATGDVTIVYATPQTNNGMARQIAIPPANYNLDYSISYTDTLAGSTQPSSNEGKIISAGTATILPAPATSTTRLIKTMSITNTDPYISSLVVVQKNISGKVYQQASRFTLLAGETAQYIDKNGWKYYAANGAIKADQTTLQSNTTDIQFNSSSTLNQTVGPTWTTSNTGIVPFAIDGIGNTIVQQSNASSLSWYGFTASSDGRKVAGIVNGGYIYTSIDSGYNWTQQTSSGSRNWRAIAGSLDGTKLVAVVNGGYIYTSADSGVTWVQQTGSSSRNWVAVTSSVDGSKIAAVVYAGYIYTSADSGVTWTALTGVGSRNWNSIASSADGSRIVAAEYGGTMYTSTDSGQNWTTQAGSGSRNWYSLVSSADGKKLAASAQSDYIYTSNDSGVTWIAQTGSGSRNWYTMATSPDGTTLVAAANGDYLYLSTDSGITWSQLIDSGPRNWVGVSISSDGSKIVAGVSTGYAYTYTSALRTTKALTLPYRDSILALTTRGSDPIQNSNSILLAPPTPTIIGNSAHDAAGYNGAITPSVTSPSTTQVGDLMIIIGYVEPINESAPGASFGNFTLPTGVTLAPGFPIETDPATFTSTKDHRMYVWYYYATTAGVTTLTFSNDQQIYWGLASVTVHGGPTSGNPFADTPSTAVSGTNAAGVTATPPVSLTLGGANNLVLWAYTDWEGGNNPGYPPGITDASHASNYPGQPALGYATYAAAGSTVIVSSFRSGGNEGMTAALLSLRGTTPPTPYVASVGTPARNNFATPTSSFNIPVPSGIVSGDLIIIAMGIEWNSTTLPDTTSLSSPGFTVAQMAAYQSYSSYAETSTFLYKYASAVDTGNYIITLNTVSGGSADIVAGVAAIVRGGPTSGNPFVDPYQMTHGVNSQTVTLPSFKPTADNTLLLASVWYNDTSTTLSTTPPGWTTQANFPSGTSTMLSSFEQSTAAATGSLTWGSTTGSPDPVVLIGAIRSPNPSQALQIANNSLALYGRTTSGRPTMSVIDATFSPMAVQAALWQNNTVIWTPGTNVGTWQGSAGATVGVAASVLPTTTNVYTAMRRSTFSSVATTPNQQIGIRSESMFFLGGGTGQGGFFFTCRFGFDAIATGMRAFIGFCPSTNIVNTDPSTSLNTVGFGFDVADAAFSFYHNNGAGTAVKEPISGQGTLATNNTGYDAYIWSPGNSAYIYYRLDRTDTGATIVDSFVSSVLPANGTMLLATAQMSNGTANTAVNAAVLGINRLYIETNR